MTGQVVKAVLRSATKQTEATEFRAAARQLMAADSLLLAIGKGPAPRPAISAGSDDATPPSSEHPDPGLRAASLQEAVTASAAAPAAPTNSSLTAPMSADRPLTAAPPLSTASAPVPTLQNFADSHGTVTASVRTAPEATAVAPPTDAGAPPRAVDVLEDVLQRVQDIRRILATQVSAPTTPEEADHFCRLVDQIVQRLRLAADGAPPCHADNHPSRRNRS